RHGLVRRVHGGAIPVERLGFEPAVAAKDTVMTEEKERIAKAALAEVPPGGAILLDAGTTTARLANILPADRELTVVTHSLIIASTLSTRRNLTLMLVGGRLRGRTMAMVDSWALNALQETFDDVAFIATNGLSVERGLTTPDTAEAMVKRAAITAARRVVLLADHTKVGNDHFARFGELSQVDTFITDNGIDDGAAAEDEAPGPRVVQDGVGRFPDPRAAIPRHPGQRADRRGVSRRAAGIGRAVLPHREVGLLLADHDLI